MSSRLNLNDNTSDVFCFTIGGLDYDLKYPTMEDLKPIQEIGKKLNLIQKDDKLSEEEKEAKLEPMNEEMTNLMYEMIIPVGHDTPIKTTLDKQPFPVIKKFNEMLKTQLAAE